MFSFVRLLLAVSLALFDPLVKTRRSPPRKLSGFPVRNGEQESGRQEETGSTGPADWVTSMATNTDVSLNLTATDVAKSFADPVWAARFPPVLSVEQVAALLQVPKLTIYDWHSRGLLKGSCRKTGKYLRFFRDRLLLLIFNEGLHNV